MLYTREWVEEKYNYYNKLIWGGELPSFGDIEFSIVKTKKRWGCAGCKSWGRDSHGIPYAKQPVLQLSNYYDAPEWAKLNTLVHEMCHLYEFFCEPTYILDVYRKRRYTSQYPKHGHGTVFYEQANRVESICGIEITRFVSQERLASASLSNEVRDKIQGKIDGNGGIDMILVVLERGGRYGLSYGYSKPNTNALSGWKDFINNHPESARKYFSAVALCKAYSLDIDKIPTSRKVNWYDMSCDVEEFIKKYNIRFIDFLMGDESDFGEMDDAKPNEVQMSPKEKRYKSFTLKFTNGKILRYENVTKEDVANNLRKEFPKWPDATIDKFVNNEDLYMEGRNDFSSLDMLIERTVRKELKRMQDKPEIEPFSDEEMSNLSGFVVVD